MKVIFGVILIVLGIVVGLYVGVYLMFIGGIIDIVEFAKTEWSSYELLTWGIIKIIFAGFTGWLCAFIFFVPGSHFVDEN